MLISKKRLAVMFSGTAVTMFASGAMVAGIVSAQSPSDESGSASSTPTTESSAPASFEERVATIIGVEASDLERAIDQVKSEIEAEEMQSKLASLVSEGVITQAQSDEISAWYASKPDVTFNEDAFEGKSKDKADYWMMGDFDDYTVEDHLSKLVDSGVISQEDADALQDWYDAMPSVLGDLESREKDRHHGWEGKKRGGKGRWDIDFESFKECLADSMEDDKGDDAEGEESGTQYALDETYDETRAGARLILSYNSDSNTFTGTVTNTTSATLSRVRVEIHLSNGIELGPTTPTDLSPGQSVSVSLLASSDRSFTSWSAHPEVGGASGDSSSDESGGAEGSAESGGEHSGSGSNEHSGRENSESREHSRDSN